MTTYGHTSALADSATPSNAPLRSTAIGTGIVIAAVPFVSELLFTFRATPAELAAMTPDDTYYYLEVARRAAAGEGFTFDGINGTTGFHPLWQWLLTGIHLLVPGDTAFVRAAHLLAVLLVAAAFALTARVIWRAAGPAPAIGGLLLASRSAVTLWDLTDGMETALVVFLLALLLTVLTSFFGGPNERRAFVCGVVCAGLVLARLDMVVVVPIVGVAILAATRSAQVTVRWLIGGLAVGIPYAGWHLWQNGQILTTSAAVKQRWTDELVTGELEGWFSARHLLELSGITTELLGMIWRQVSSLPVLTGLGTLVGVGVALLVAIGTGRAAHRLRESGSDIGPAGRAALVLAAMLFAKFLVDLVVAPIWVLSWYSTPARTAAAWAIGAAAVTGAAALSRSSHWWAFVVVPIGVLAILPTGLTQILDARYGYVWQPEVDRAADWVVAEGPTGVYGSFDAGLAGYRLHGLHPLVNLDGLVNDHDFAAFLADNPGRLAPARRERVDILIGPLPVAERLSELACASTLWEGETHFETHGDANSGSRVFVLDLRPCERAGQG